MEEEFSCRIEVAGSSLTTLALAGSDPLWEAAPFTFCVHEDPWPLEIGVRLLGKSAKQDTTEYVNFAIGHLLLQDSSIDLNASCSITTWWVNNF